MQILQDYIMLIHKNMTHKQIHQMNVSFQRNNQRGGDVWTLVATLVFALSFLAQGGQFPKPCSLLFQMFLLCYMGYFKYKAKGWHISATCCLYVLLYWSMEINYTVLSYPTSFQLQCSHVNGCMLHPALGCGVVTEASTFENICYFTLGLHWYWKIW